MANQTEIIRVGQIEIRFLLEGKDTNGQLAMFEFTVPAGARVGCPITTSVTTKSFMAWTAS